MTMKRTDLAKSKMIKADNAVKIAGIPDRFGTGSAIPDRREQRKADAAAGLIPFACKLPGELIATIRARVEKDKSDVNTLMVTLLEKGLKAK